MRGTRSLIAVVLLAAGQTLGAGAAAGQNPVDPVSNPNALDYENVEARPAEMGPPFLRQGQFVDAQRLAAIRPGVSESNVRAVLGQPLAEDSLGGDWDYDVRFKLPQSQNVLVCQYKVRFDEERRVRETTWRRRQCERLAAGDPLA